MAVKIVLPKEAKLKVPSPVASSAVKKAAKLLPAVAAQLATLPALAAQDYTTEGLGVGSRLAKEGTGQILGLAEPQVTLATVIVFGIVWALWATSASKFGGQQDDDGLSL